MGATKDRAVATLGAVKAAVTVAMPAAEMMEAVRVTTTEAVTGVRKEAVTVTTLEAATAAPTAASAVAVTEAPMEAAMAG